MYGTIRMHQERDYPAGSSAPTSTTRTSPRSPGPMAATARWSSAPRISRPRSDRAEEAGTFALLDLRVDPEALTPKLSLEQIRAGALARS